MHPLSLSHIVNTIEQRLRQVGNQPTHVEDLLPIRTLLRTKRAKRCRTCQRNIIRPEPKAQEMSFKMKYLAMFVYLPIG